MTYRDRIYERYTSISQGSPAVPVVQEMDHWGAAYDSYLRGWLPAEADAPIVDLACGYGRLLRYFSQRGFSDVTGVDVSPEQVEIARRVHARVEQGDVLDFLNRHPGRFALITAFDIIEHLGKDEVLSFLDACHRALRTGGYLVLQTPNADSPWGMGVRYGDFTHETCFNPHSLAWLLRLCNFGSIEAREQGPVPRGLVSTVRYILWRLMRLQMLMRNLVETGSPGSAIFTRVFIARARRS